MFIFSGGDALNTVSAKKAKLCQQVTVLTPCKVNLSTQAGPSIKLVLSKSAAEKNTANNGESNDELNSKIEQRVTRLSQSAHGADFKNQPAQNSKTFLTYFFRVFLYLFPFCLYS